MKQTLYNLMIQAYWLGMYIASIFNKKASQFVNGRKKLIQLLNSDFRKNNDPVVWFHCASLGEFEQGRPVIEAFKQHFPSFKIVLTFFSPSGYEVRKNYCEADYVCYLPIDTPKKASDFVRIINPRLCFFVKYEFWYNYLKILQSKNVPTLSFSAIFRQEQIFFKSNGRFFQQMLAKFDHIFVQNEASMSLLRTINVNRVTVAGDTRFDRVWQLCQNVESLPQIDRFKSDKSLMVIGSSWPEDMTLLTPFINNNKEMKFIIAPHEIEEQYLKAIEQGIEGEVVRYSLLTNYNGTSEQVLIIDNIGMLSSLYQYGKYAYIGGAFGNGLHNILEAATFGLPLFFGNKNYMKFQEAIDLIGLEGAFAVGDYNELDQKFKLLADNQQLWSKTSDINRSYIKTHRGATQKVIDYCKGLNLNGR